MDNIFLPYLKLLTSDCSVKDNFDFFSDISQQPSKVLTTASGMDFFFINVPTDQTIGVHDKELPRISQRISGLSSQIDAVAMGSPLGPTLTNIFSCHQETKYL